MSEDFRCQSLSTFPAHPRWTVLGLSRTRSPFRMLMGSIPSSLPPAPPVAEPVSAWLSLR